MPPDFQGEDNGVIIRLSQLLQGGFREDEESINGNGATWGKTIVDSHHKDGRMRLSSGMSQLQGSKNCVNDMSLTGLGRRCRSIRGQAIHVFIEVPLTS